MRKDLLPISAINKGSTYRLWLVLLLIFVTLGFVFYKISAIIFPFVVGLVGAYIFNTPVKAMEKLGIRRAIGAAIIIFCVLLLLFLLGFQALPFLKNELLVLLKSYSNLQDKFLTLVNPLIDSAAKITGDSRMIELKKQLSDSLGNAVKWIVENLAYMLTSSISSGLAIANVISLVVLIPFIMFYALKDWPKFIYSINKLLPKPYARLIRLQAQKIDDVLGSYARGQLMVCLSLIILYSLGLFMIGLPHPLFAGFITGFFAFIPYVGVFIGFVLSMTLALTNSTEMHDIMSVFGVFLTLGLFEGYFLTPRFIGERIGLHPVFIIFALLSLGSWFGFIGLVVALPLSAVIVALLKPFIEWYKSNFAN